MIFKPCCACLPQAEVPLLEPDILVCSVGTEILVRGALPLPRMQLPIKNYG